MQRAQLILDLSKAANAHLDLTGVLVALSRGLRPEIAFDAVAVLVLNGDDVKLHALHVDESPRNPNESLQAYLFRQRQRKGLPPLETNSIHSRREHSALALLTKTGDHYACADLSLEMRFADEARMLNYGIRSYVAMPLIKSQQVIGAIEFLSYSAQTHSDERIELLRSACEIISIAVSNALAYEEIASLKDQLQNENRFLQDDIDRRWMFEEIVGSSEPLRKLLDVTAKVAPTDVTVLITGETGTGKELVARAIHRQSARASRALVTLNCASLAPELVASEMFGHEKGAFTGALMRRIGRFESADGGTIFLDEIGELSLDLQASLLRVLQERTFERVGGNQTITADVRVIAATNRELGAEVEMGRFRSDLFYRLNVFPVHAPPLRERVDDIPVLIDYFVARFSRRLGKPIRRIRPKDLDALLRYPWPGNIRELKNVLERAVILSEGDALSITNLETPVRPDPPIVAPAVTAFSAAPMGLQSAASAPGNGESALRDENAANSHQQRQRIIDALALTRGRVSGSRGAAKLLGVPASTLESRIRVLGIDKYQFRSSSRQSPQPASPQDLRPDRSS